MSDIDLLAELPQLAEVFVETAQRLDPTLTLDYSPESLDVVDEVILKWWPPKRGLFGRKPNSVAGLYRALAERDRIWPPS